MTRDEISSVTRVRAITAFELRFHHGHFYKDIGKKIPGNKVSTERARQLVHKGYRIVKYYSNNQLQLKEVDAETKVLVEKMLPYLEWAKAWFHY